MIVLLRDWNVGDRLASYGRSLAPDWEVRVTDPDGGDGAFAAALAEADAIVAMSWEADIPPAPKLRLLQLPGLVIAA